MRKPNAQLNRRALLVGGAIAATLPQGVLSAMRPEDKFDLVIKGGTVVDPSQNLNAKRDLGIRFGVVELIAEDIPVGRANRVLNVAGKTVVPGLIDLHAHTFAYGSPIAIPADALPPGACHRQSPCFATSPQRYTCPPDWETLCRDKRSPLPPDRRPPRHRTCTPKS